MDDRAAHIGEVVPQMWTWEHTVPGGQPSRSFVWMQGHTYANFSNYQIERTLLRGIAWAAGEPATRFDLLALRGARVTGK